MGPAVTSTEGQYWLPQHLPWSSSIQSSGFLEERDAGFCGTGTGGASKLSELEGSGRLHKVGLVSVSRSLSLEFPSWKSARMRVAGCGFL